MHAMREQTGWRPQAAVGLPNRATFHRSRLAGDSRPLPQPDPRHWCRVLRHLCQMIAPPHTVTGCPSLTDALLGRPPAAATARCVASTRSAASRPAPATPPPFKGEGHQPTVPPRPKRLRHRMSPAGRPSHTRSILPRRQAQTHAPSCPAGRPRHALGATGDVTPRVTRTP